MVVELIVPPDAKSTKSVILKIRPASRITGIEFFKRVTRIDSTSRVNRKNLDSCLGFEHEEAFKAFVRNSNKSNEGDNIRMEKIVVRAPENALISVSAIKLLDGPYSFGIKWELQRDTGPQTTIHCESGKDWDEHQSESSDRSDEEEPTNSRRTVAKSSAEITKSEK
eukprot:CAMPEP_0114532350 /NCGR_PEP_ID=MMETSP0109-20121206/26616_1 /TAXON_ID=29199 /ORGANISM="Chlorarachnion reptans, Strain CCCM449" /LENGTH=166 /DNA_ID=CAMNT_0001715403 /DNA_START=246 /DNA_END=746 /DNA_ORIENTATION=+